MSDESYRFFQRIEETLEPEAKPGFRACGYLFLAHSRQMRRQLELDVALQHRFGVPSRVLEPQEITEIVPSIRTDDIVAASFCAEDGYFDDPWAVLMAFASAARRLGARIQRAEISSVCPDGSGWGLILADGRHTSADGVVIAAGADSLPILATLGWELPIRAEPRYLFYSRPIPDKICEPLVVSNEKRLAVKQLSDGQILTSYLGAGRDGAGETPEAWKAEIADAAVVVLPALLDVELTHLVKGYYDVTPDQQPAVGALPGMDGIWVAAGLSGHGFMMAPAIGRAVANLVTGGAIPWWVSELRLDRFESRSLVAESRII
jgi:sarcosine oxidase subunit beta